MGGSTMKVRMYSTTDVENTLGTEMQGLASQLMKQLQDGEESGDVHAVEVQTIESQQIGNLLAKMLSSDSSLASDDAETASDADGAAEAQNLKVFKQLFAQALAPSSDDESSDDLTDVR